MAGKKSKATKSKTKVVKGMRMGPGRPDEVSDATIIRAARAEEQPTTLEEKMEQLWQESLVGGYHPRYVQRLFTRMRPRLDSAWILGSIHRADQAAWEENIVREGGTVFKGPQGTKYKFATRKGTK
jgi:hypothetical protein